MNALWQKKGFPVVALVGLVWLAAGTGDWFMRFHWYRWHTTLISRPEVRASGPFAPMADIEMPPVKGGDLSHLVAIPTYAAAFEEERPAMRERTDEAGFRNVPPTEGRSFPVVVVGSSYMNSGYPMTNTFSARLADELHVDVYNHAFPGHGPFFALLRFLADARFDQRPPKVLVWGIVEREIGGGVFAGLTYHLEHLQAAGTNDVAPAAGRGFLWSSLLPATLKHALPDSSAIAQFAAKAWNRVRFAVFGQLTPEVAVATRPIAGGPMLFYAPAVHALKWTPAQRRVFQVADVLGQLDQVCRERGMRLAIVLIPDKEQVYKDYLPASLNSDESPIPESCLVELEGDLRERGIPVVNLLPAFAERAARGELLYWRDDTHWNTEAIRLAAQEAAGIIGPLLSGAAVEPMR